MTPKGIILTATDFKVIESKVYINTTKVGKNPGMLLIWGDFCGHCHRFMPTFNTIVGKLGNDFSCASIESEEFQGNENLASALNFSGYPTICFFDQNGFIMGQYNGNRDEESILNQICKAYHHCAKYH